MHHMARVGVVVAVAVWLAAACTGDDLTAPVTSSTSTSVADDPSTTTSVPEVFHPTRRSLADLVALVPDELTTGEGVVVLEWERASTLRLESERFRELRDALELLGHQSWFETGRGDEVAAWREEVGFAYTDVIQEVVAGQRPDVVRLLQTTVKPTTIATAVINQPQEGGVETRRLGGRTMYLWNGERCEPNLGGRLSASNVLGLDRQMAMVDDGGLVAVTCDVRRMEAVLADRGQSSAALLDLAACIDDDGLIAARLEAGMRRFNPGLHLRSESTPEEVAAVEERLALAPRLGPYLAQGVIVTVGDGPDPVVATLVLVHEGPADASDNRQRLMDQLELGGPLVSDPKTTWIDNTGPVEISVDGRCVVATFVEAGRATYTLGASFSSHETLLIGEED